MNGYQRPEFHETTPPGEIRDRTARMQAGLRNLGLDGLLIVHNVDLFYFAGTMQAAHLFIPADGPPLLMVRRDLDRARAESPLADVVGLSSLRDLPIRVRDRLGFAPRRLGLELDVMPVATFRTYETLWPTAELVDASPAVMNLRAVKSDYEVGWMRRAGDLARRVYARVPDLLRPGMTEIELAGLITAEAYAGGHQNYLRTRAFNQELYTWHVISGESGGVVSSIDAPFGGYGLSPAFPVGASLRTIRAGEPVLLDFGLCLNGYQVDLTRMFSIGPTAERLREAYCALQEIEAVLAGRLRPGATGDELYRLAVELGDRLGFGEAFLGPGDKKARFVGHGVGLEITDPPLLAPGRTTPLKAGMTAALELKMVFPGLGAVGLENTFLIRDGEPENLTPADGEFGVLEL